MKEREPRAPWHDLGRLVVGLRRPWASSVVEVLPESDDAFLAPLRLARQRQNAGLEGRRAHARSLLRCELDGVQAGCLRLDRRFGVEELIAQTVVSSGFLHVIGVARPLPDGIMGVGDPGSGDTVEAEGLRTAVSRGSAVEVAGWWDAPHKRLSDAMLVRSRPLSENVVHVLADRLPEDSEPLHVSCNSLQSRQKNRIRPAPRPDEAILLPQAVEILETELPHLSLSTLCRVHALLVHSPAGIGGRLRDGPAVVRLQGRTTFVPPPARAARDGAEAFAVILARHLGAVGEHVRPAALAAEAVACFTDLHPFGDGNGRVARAIATWLLMRADYRPKPDWTLGQFFHLYQGEHYMTLRHHERDPWSWHQFFFDAVLTCFVAPYDTEVGSGEVTHLKTAFITTDSGEGIGN